MNPVPEKENREGGPGVADAIVFKELCGHSVAPEPTTGCWLWTGRRFANGYGYAYFLGKSVLVHRLSWLLCRGAVPDGLCVLHRCDVKACVNPSHLFLGTHADNVADKVAKRRQAKRTGHGRARLSEEDVAEIRRAHAQDAVSATELARRFGVGRTTIGHIIAGRTWRGARP